MGYPAMTPKWESRKTPPEGGRKAMQGERHTQNQCGQFVHIDSVRITLGLNLTFCQATVKSGKC